MFSVECPQCGHYSLCTPETGIPDKCPKCGHQFPDENDAPPEPKPEEIEDEQ